MRQPKTRVGHIIAPMPNWSDSVIESYEFLTDIITSEDGTEQRVSERLWPRVEVSYRFDDMDVMGDMVMSDRIKWPDKGLHTLSCRWRRVYLDQAVSAGGTTLSYLGGQRWWLVPGSTIVLENDTLREEVIVDTVDDTTITLNEGPENAFEIGTVISLALPARYKNGTGFEARTTRHRGGTADLAIDPGGFPNWQLLNGPQYSAKGYEVFHFDPEWSQPPTFEFDDNRELIDLDRGIVDVYRSREFPTVQFNFRYRELTPYQADLIINFFMRKKGRRGSFWFPTRLWDIRPIFNTGAGSKTLTVEGDLSAYSGNKVFNHIYVEFPDGCFQINKIISMAGLSGNTVLTVEDGWERAVAAGQVRCCWCPLSRFATDRLEAEWHTPRAASLRIGFTALPSNFVDSSTDWRRQPLWESPIALWSNFDAPWDDPENRPFTEMDLRTNGFPLSLVDQGKATCSAEWSGIVEATGSLIWEYRIGAYFFDENDVPVELPGGTTRWYVFLEGARPDKDSVDYFTVTMAPSLIPPGTRIVRWRRGQEHSTVDGSNVHQCRIDGRNWGQIYSAEVLQCP